MSLYTEAIGDIRSQEGTWYHLRELDKLSSNNVAMLDMTFENVPDDVCGNCRFDIIMTNGTKIELKSYTKNSLNRIAGYGPGDNFFKQHLAYLSDAGTNNLNRIKYKFDLEKFYGKPLAQITETEKQQALTYIKGKFKRMYVNNAENMFKPIRQGGLGQAKMKQLFEFGEFRFNTVSEFKGFLNNQEFLDNALKFVKAE